MKTRCEQGILKNAKPPVFVHYKECGKTYQGSTITKLIVFIALPIIVAAFLPPVAFVEPEVLPNANVGIFLTDSCQQLNKMGSWTCPRYTQFLELDNSDPWASGSMIWQRYDVFREDSPVQEGMRFYDCMADPLVILDPPADHVN